MDRKNKAFPYKKNYVIEEVLINWKSPGPKNCSTSGNHKPNRINSCTPASLFFNNNIVINEKSNKRKNMNMFLKLIKSSNQT